MKNILLREGVCILLLCLFFVVFQGCSIPVTETEKPLQVTDAGYSLGSGDGIAPADTRWWESFNDPHLNELVESALADNLSLQQGIARLMQVMSLEERVASEELPPVDLNYDYSAKKEEGASQTSSSEIEIGLSWEIDLWGRLSNASKAAELQTVAAREDVEDLALLISFQIATIYYQLVEQRLQRDLLGKQIEVNSIYQNLVELRFANGAASVVDVYQQRQLLTGNKTKMLLVEEQIVSLENTLNVLLGRVPGGGGIISTSVSLPDLPQFPSLGLPADLLLNRPDLRSLQAKLQSSHHTVAAAVAERLPKIRIGGSVGLTDGDLFYTFFGDAFAAVIDWNKRKSEVERQKAVAWENTSLYAEAYLKAVEEVENSLWREHYHVSLVQTVQYHVSLARATLLQSRNRYMQGVTDYLPVLAALQALQNLEQNNLLRQRELIENRMLLCRALGGSVIDQEEAVSSFLLDRDTSRLP